MLNFVEFLIEFYFVDGSWGSEFLKKQQNKDV